MQNPLSHAWERVRSDAVETLDIVGGEGDGAEQVIHNRQKWFAWIPAFAGKTGLGKTHS